MVVAVDPTRSHIALASIAWPASAFVLSSLNRSLSFERAGTHHAPLALALLQLAVTAGVAWSRSGSELRSQFGRGSHLWAAAVPGMFVLTLTTASLS